MNDFDYDVKQKKNIARSARYVKNGSKSRKCNLPSDGMTEKEWKEKNGVVTSYSMNAPMTWETFVSMPKELQGEYIFGLAETYHPSQRQIAEMFRVNREKCAKRIRDLGVWPYALHDSRATDEQKAAWVRFLGNWNMGVVMQKEDAPKIEKVVEKKEEKKEEKVVVPRIKENVRKVRIDKGSITLSGTAKEVMEKLCSILDIGEYLMTIEFSEVLYKEEK